MVFKRKGFFLTFDEGAAKNPATVAPVPTSVAEEAPQPAATAPGAEQAAPLGQVPTTAEAIAAELRVAQANRPAPSLATFAPANLTPGGALPVRRRQGGASLAPFRAIASSLFRS